MTSDLLMGFIFGFIATALVGGTITILTIDSVLGKLKERVR